MIKLGPRNFIRTLHRRVPSDIAFAFDIDGVLLRSKHPIDAARRALTKLKSLKIPFIMFTNGGGTSEADRVNFLSKSLGVELSPLQILQSHTPFKALAKNDPNQRVLVVGGPGVKARQVALDYGFKNVFTPVDIVRANPSIWPWQRYSSQQIDSWGLDPSVSKFYGESAVPFDRILVFNDPRDLGTDMQIVLDLLNSQDGFLGTRRKSGSPHPSVPICFSNNDFLWANDYNLPRFGQGAFRMIVETLYKESNDGQTLERTILGKPFKVAYDYAHHMLIDWREKLLANKTKDLTIEKDIVFGQPPKSSPFTKVYMVGDNPASDIAGGNNYGWETILVRTGVFRDDDFVNDRVGKLARPSVGVFDDVEKGVDHVLERL